MFSFKRVWAIVWRHLLVLKSPFDLMSCFYWVFIDIVIFGFMATSLYLVADKSNLSILLSSLVLFHITARGCVTAASSVQRDLIETCLISIFATPTKLFEWLLALFVIGLIAGSGLTFLWGGFLLKLLFGINILDLGLKLIPAILLLLISSFNLMFLILSLLIKFGKRAISLIYMLPWALSPFAGAFYPIDILPSFFQKIAKIFPLYYIFAFIRDNKNLNDYIFKGLILNIIFFIFMFLLFIYVFKNRKREGLVSLETGGA